MPVRKESTNPSGEETLGIGIHLRKADPANIETDGYRKLVWDEAYRLLWKLKILGRYY